MAITSAVCNSFKAELLQGIHTTSDTYKIALFASTATLDKTTTSYSGQTGEVASGLGYTTGGVALTGCAAALSGDTANLDFNDASIGPGATFGPVRGGLIYNSSKSNKAVAVVNWGTDYTANDYFNIPIANAVSLT